MCRDVTFCCDHFVGQVVRQCRFPIVQPPRRECRIEQLLHRDIRQWSDRVRYRGSEVPQRRYQTLAFIERSDVARNRRNNQITVRQSQDPGPGLQIVGLGGGEFAVKAQDLYRLTDGARPYSPALGQSGAGDTPKEVTTPNCARPRGCPRRDPRSDGARRAQLPVGYNDVYREQIVDGEAVFAAEPALPSAEGQAGDAGGRDGADRRRQTEGLRLAVELGPENARFRTDYPRAGVDADALHARRVDHQAAITNRVAGDAVTAAFS